jgi:hypothetical protein
MPSPATAAPEVTQWASAVQEEAFNYGPYPHVLSGGFGSGKTFAACRKVLLYCDLFPKNRIVIFRWVGRELRQTTMATFFKMCPPSLYQHGGRRNDQEGLLRLNNGSEILFMHLEDPNVQGILKGLEINGFFGDQAEENPEHMEDIFDLLMGRLGRWDVAEVPPAILAYEEQRTGRPWAYRSRETNKPLPPPLAMLAVNPDSELHWIYRRFHPESPEYHEKYATRGYKMFHMPSMDNKFLSDVNRDALLSQDESFIRRYVKGEWGFPEGAIHTVHRSSVLEGTRALVDWLKQTCTLFRTFDYGDSAPTCCVWWAVDRNGNVFAVREYYLPNAIISTHRGNISGLSAGERYEMNLADPSIFHQMPAKQGGRFSVADEYAEVQSQPRQTAIFWSPADNNELGTRNRINEYLRFDSERIHPITKQPGAARLFFVTRTAEWEQGIVHALQQTRSQRRVKIGTDLGKPVFSDERDPSVTDHAYDCLRYMIASRAPVPPAEQPRSYGTFTGARRLAKQHRQNGTIR